MAPEIRVTRARGARLVTVTGGGRTVSAYRAAAAEQLLNMIEAAGGTATVTVTDNNGLDARTQRDDTEEQ